MEREAFTKYAAHLLTDLAYGQGGQLAHDVEKLPAGVPLAAPNRYIHWDSSNDRVESPI